MTTDDILLGRLDVNGTWPQSGVVGPITIATGTVVHCSLVWGPTGASNIWLRGVSFRARRISGDPIQFTLQRRTKEGGTWSSWSDRNSWEVLSTAWDQYTSSATLVGNYEDVEERLITSFVLATQTNALADITMTATDIIK